MKKQTFIFPCLLLALSASQVQAQTTQEAYVKASTVDRLDGFGQCISLSGDTKVVTALGEDSGATGIDGDQSDRSGNGSGAAYVFVRDENGSWTQQAYLKQSNTEARDNFGFSCAVDGDTVVIGARWEDSNARGANGDQSDNSSFHPGAAYVFVRSGTTWTQQAYLKASNTPPFDDGFDNGDSFGVAVAIDGDTIVVGAPYEDSGSRGVNGDGENNDVWDSGAAYVFTRNGTTWSEQAYLKQSNTGITDDRGARDVFGLSVSVSGDTIAVGAAGEDSASTGINGEQFNNDAVSSGAVYVFTRSGTAWSQEAYIKGDVVEVGDTFGNVVKVDGNTLAIAVSHEDSNETGVNTPNAEINNASRNSGAVYVYERDSNSTWVRQAFIKASNTLVYRDANIGSDNFGVSLGLFGDRLVVGATGEDSDAVGVNNGDGMNDNTYNTGAAYVFTRSGSTWSQESYLKASNPDELDFFGVSVAISGDLIAVGSRSEESSSTGVNGDQSDNSQDTSGAVYIFNTGGK